MRIFAMFFVGFGAAVITYFGSIYLMIGIAVMTVGIVEYSRS